jgi:hypothetical protein
MEMKDGAFNTIPKGNDKVFSENTRDPHDSRKRPCRNHISNNVRHFISSISRASFTLKSFYKASQPSLLCEILKRLREAVRRKRPKLRPNDLVLHRDNAPAHKALSSSFWQRICYWNGTQTPFYWFNAEGLLAVSKNKVFLKETKISGLKTKNVTPLKSIPQQELQKCFH